MISFSLTTSIEAKTMYTVQSHNGLMFIWLVMWLIINIQSIHLSPLIKDKNQTGIVSINYVNSPLNLRIMDAPVNSECTVQYFLFRNFSNIESDQIWTLTIRILSHNYTENNTWIQHSHICEHFEPRFCSPLGVQELFTSCE